VTARAAETDVLLPKSSLYHITMAKLETTIVRAVGDKWYLYFLSEHQLHLTAFKP
jgi:hypothetical protein